MIYVHVKEGGVQGFYHRAVHNGEMPEGTIEISEEEWQYALEINANAYENGQFVVKDFRKESEKAAALAKANRNKRDRLINEIEWRLLRYERQSALNIETADTAGYYHDTLVYLQALREVPQQAEFPHNIDWPVLHENQKAGD